VVGSRYGQGVIGGARSGGVCFLLADQRQPLE
jgi:hypothetical protein